MLSAHERGPNNKGGEAVRFQLCSVLMSEDLTIKEGRLYIWFQLCSVLMSEDLTIEEERLYGCFQLCSVREALHEFTTTERV